MKSQFFLKNWLFLPLFTVKCKAWQLQVPPPPPFFNSLAWTQNKTFPFSAHCVMTSENIKYAVELLGLLKELRVVNHTQREVK